MNTWYTAYDPSTMLIRMKQDLQVLHLFSFLLARPGVGCGIKMSRMSTDRQVTPVTLRARVDIGCQEKKTSPFFTCSHTTLGSISIVKNSGDDTSTEQLWYEPPTCLDLTDTCAVKTDMYRLTFMYSTPCVAHETSDLDTALRSFQLTTMT